MTHTVQTITYTADPAWTGTDTFAYTVSDDHGQTATAIVTVVCRQILGPDLVVTDVGNEDRTICCQIRNIGQAVARAGYMAALFVDGVSRSALFVETDLEPGARWKGRFDYLWPCSFPEDLIVVQADYGNAVAEHDETNNSREETWKCDSTPPGLIGGPTVLATTSAARITWETDEDSDSAARYGRRAQVFDHDGSDPAPIRSHNMTLDGLEPSTTYHFVVRSTDLSGNTAESRDIIFETRPTPDDRNPAGKILDPAEGRGTVTIRAEASDDEGVERVEFSAGGRLLFTDFSQPYSALLDTLSYDNGDYDIKGTAFDFSQKSAIDQRPMDIANIKDWTAPTVTITSHKNDVAVSGKVGIVARLEDDTGIDSARFYVDGNWRGIAAFYPEKPTSATVTFTWDTGAETTGKHSIAVEAMDAQYKLGWHIITVNVEAPLPPAPPPSPPRLSVIGHTVARRDHRFIVMLTVRNEGDVEATDVCLRDGLTGFQPIERDSDPAADFLAHYVPATKSGYCEIQAKHSIPPGQSRIYTYHAVPVLTCPDPPIPQIRQFIDLSWASPTETAYHDYVEGPVAKTTENESLLQAYENAVRACNYLIVTNPGRLFAFGGQATAVDILLAMTARLAHDKQGVLGYLFNYSAPGLQNLIRPGGDWSSKLFPLWTFNGYLLLVGEAEIIPAYNSTHSAGWGESFRVRWTDLPYANTAGDWCDPEPVIGRIIGDEALDLIIPVKTSVSVCEGLPPYGFDRSQALVLSGWPAFRGGGSDEIDFPDQCDEVIDELRDKGTSTTAVLPTTICPTAAFAAQLFFSLAPGKGIIHLTGHGGQTGLDDLEATAFLARTNPFGSIHPVVFGSSCLTGQYALGPNTFAEAILRSGAGVYIGSTEVSYGSANADAGEIFYEAWDLGESVGSALKQVKIDISGFHEDIWSSEYHLYRDPKYGEGGTSAQAASLAIASAEEPLSSFRIVVPDYEVTTKQGAHQVDIPGGHSLRVPGKPLVPFYGASLDYPVGHRVQDVVLTARSGLTTTTGLDISNFVPAIAGASRLMDTPASGAEWFPEEIFAWNAQENPDGSSTLAIRVCPSYYNSLTTDVQFYKEYNFAIHYTISPVVITRVATDKDEYVQGEAAAVNLLLDNTREAQDVIVSASVRRLGSGEIVDGLLLRTLHSLRGKASFSSTWDSTGFDPGYYYVEATLQDTGGNVLDRQTSLFKLGVSSGAITSFQVNPTRGPMGENVNINMAFRNTGTVAITGIAQVRVLNDSGNLMAEFAHDITGLLPSESISFSDVWTLAETNPCRILGYVSYDGKATEPATVEVSPHQRKAAAGTRGAGLGLAVTGGTLE